MASNYSHRSKSANSNTKISYDLLAYMERELASVKSIVSENNAMFREHHVIHQQQDQCMQHIKAQLSPEHRQLLERRQRQRGKQKM